MIKAGHNPKGANTMSEITYTKQDDYLIPDLTLPTEPELPLGRYALMHRIIWNSTEGGDVPQPADVGQAERTPLPDQEQTALKRLEVT